jgi:hypothetical protein
MLSGTYEKTREYRARFGSISSTYAFSTENIGGYFPRLNLEDSAVLTVAASGDHIVNAHLYGAKSVTAFDSNVLSLSMSDLKIVALQKLDFVSFMKFFMRENLSGPGNNLHALDYGVYSDLRDGLNPFSKTIFDVAYDVLDKDGTKLRESAFFNNQYDSNLFKIKVNPYLLSKENYDLAKSTIRKPNYIFSRIEKLTSRLPSDASFDVVLLSNIADYARQVSNRSSGYLEDFARTSVFPLAHNLNAKGEICAAYVYMTNADDISSNEIDDPDTRAEAFGQSSLIMKEYPFRSIIPSKMDTVVLLKKHS